ncbi:glycosyltransferase [Desulfovibrio sp. JC022]|uniref:glycosyltransferase n=1 Tax=Desulfovibrio sp. JC022 TaxID=2593642 RepID=UPI0013CF85DA|nr:glycosyltransferase [Desulfovibrio sp. JC022]
MGGAEKTTLVMQEAFPNSKICVDFFNRNSFKKLGETDIIELGKPSTCQPLNAIKGIQNFKRKTGFLKDYDLVIYSGSYAPCAVQNQVKGKKVLYCHTIPRFAYDLYSHYFENIPRAARSIFKMLVAYVRKNYERAFSEMDLVIANSQNVRSRIQKYLNADAIVINPPVDTSAFKWLGQQDYYLSTARLEKYKRVDLIVTAFKKMPDKKLIVTSGGSELKNLQKLAGNAPNISFTDWIDHEELIRLMGNAIATIYMPKDEDFGMSPVESMAAGKPVIGVNEGGVMETVMDGETGIFVKTEVRDIVRGVGKLSPQKALNVKETCKKRADEFNTDNFLVNLKKHINQNN